MSPHRQCFDAQRHAFTPAQSFLSGGGGGSSCTLSRKHELLSFNFLPRKLLRSPAFGSLPLMIVFAATGADQVNAASFYP
jgi:hypothetical protein